MTPDTRYLDAKRLEFPGDEAKEQWLAMLLEAYFRIDIGIAEAIQLEEGKNLACTKHCADCCKNHMDIPVYPLELVGLSWYATEKIKDPERSTLKQNLKNYKVGSPCPFLMDDYCSAHIMRPIACRQFMVFNKACEKGEDPYYTRRDDVLSPIKNYVDEAFFSMLPFYGVHEVEERMQAIENGDLHKTVTTIPDCNWKALSDKMDEYDGVKE